MEFSSRMKDYYDIYYLANKFDFDGAILTEALRKTFENRGHIFTIEQFEQVMAFDDDEAMQKKWKVFCRKIDTKTDSYSTVLRTIRAFLTKPIAAVITRTFSVNNGLRLQMYGSKGISMMAEKFIKELHLTLKSGTSDSRKDWFAAGDYKKLPNEVGGMDTALPEEVASKMKALLTTYNVKEDLKYNIVPFIIEDNLKMFYYRGLKEWDNEKGYLTDTCLTAQDRYKAFFDYFRIPY